MEALVRGDIVVLPFPFSDLSGTKRRPALVIKELRGNDIILCQITGETRKEKTAVYVDNKDFILGNLKGPSSIRSHKLFTADKEIIEYKIGKINHKKTSEVKEKLINIIKI